MERWFEFEVENYFGHVNRVKVFAGDMREASATLKSMTNGWPIRHSVCVNNGKEMKVSERSLAFYCD